MKLFAWNDIENRTRVGNSKGADRSPNPGDVSTGATGGSEARNEPREASGRGLSEVIE
ncbi:hypothetical protein HSRCO_0810 [Halanaeroarchaeum sp. HSR-CO]|nr:hypothetical protein HSRCO_0810 [Halanaeroarchaeum sp. HSR-CO]